MTGKDAMQRHLVAAGGAVRTISLWVARHRRTSAVAAGLAAGIAGWAVAHHFVATFGFTREVVAGVLIACVASCAAGRFAAMRMRSDYGLASLLAAGWLVLTPIMLAGATTLVAATPIVMDAERTGSRCAADLCGPDRFRTPCCRRWLHHATHAEVSRSQCVAVRSGCGSFVGSAPAVSACRTASAAVGGVCSDSDQLVRSTRSRQVR